MCLNSVLFPEPESAYCHTDPVYDPSVADYVKEVHRPNYKLHVIHSSEAWANMNVHPMDGGKNPRKLFGSSGNGDL